MADNSYSNIFEGIPVTFTNIKGAVDKEYINPELTNLDILSNIENFNPFRKVGSLVLAPDATIEYTQAQLPSPTDYILKKIHKFQIDRDNKEITMLIYQKSDNSTKIYIDKWYNPDVMYDNYSSYHTTIGWQYTKGIWYELTENYNGTIQNTPAPSGSTVVIDGTNIPTKTDDYYNGWFIVDLSAAGFSTAMITDYDSVTKTMTLNISPYTCAWNNGDIIYICRFPVTYLYSKDVLNFGGNGTFTKSIDTFITTPTDYIYSNNQLRIACSKNYRPLIIDMIYKRDYMYGNRPYKYDGIWFDFQQPIQQFKTVAITGCDTSATTSNVFCRIDINGQLSTTATDYLKIERKLIPGILYVHISPTSADSTYTTLITGKVWIKTTNSGETIWFKKNEAITTSDLVTAINGCFLSPYYVASIVGSLATITPTTTLPFYFGTVALNSNWGEEAGGNRVSENLFLGTKVSTTALVTASASAVSRVAFIITGLVDNRNEVILGIGTYCPYIVDSPYSYLQLAFNSWFSRRITGFNLYIRRLIDFGTVLSHDEAMVLSSDTYPYFQWRTDKATYGTNGANGVPLRINEIPLFMTFSSNKIIESKDGEIAGIDVVSMTIDKDAGKNAYTWSSNCWYTLFSKQNNNIQADGEGLKFLVNTNRFIDQDITMNYTKGTFVGQTNGRYFISGCKNTVEREELDNADMIFPNTYAVGVSQYDTFIRNNNIPVYLGDKDIVRTLLNHKGYLFIIKDTNTYALDVTTDDEIKYRVVDTMIGRGTINIDSICSTPYGIVIPTQDGVWLLSPSSTELLMTPSNAQLNYYKSQYSTATTVLSIYSKEYNELLIFMDGFTRVTGTCVFVYSFIYKMWTKYIWNGCFTYSVTKDSLGNIYLLNRNVDNSKWNIVKIDESTNNGTFTLPTGSTSDYSPILETHYLPLGYRFKQVMIPTFSISYDYNAGASSKFLISLYGNSDNSIVDREIIPTTSGSVIKYNRYKDQNMLLDNAGAIVSPVDMQTMVKVKITTSNNFKYLSINSFTVWLSLQDRKRTL